MSENSREIFFYSDAWVLATLLDGNIKTIDFRKIIAYGDKLNRAIMLPEEIKLAFIKLQQFGVIVLQGINIQLTAIGKKIKRELNKIRQVFDKVSFTKQRINSSELNLQPNSGYIDTSEFITDDLIIKGMQEYGEELKKIAEKRRQRIKKSKETK